MSSDPSLYGIRKPKNTPKEISSSTSLAFSSTLSGLLASSSTASRTTTARSRPSKTKEDIFSSHNRGASKRAARDLDDNEGYGSKIKRQALGEVDEDILHKSKRKMEQKAKLYAKMKRGDLPGFEGEDLIDFDRKWAESVAKGEVGDNSSDLESDDGQGEMVEYEDEYGRLRRGTKAEAERMNRKKQNRALGAEELDRMSARPAMPEKLIYGDTVQSLAFNPEEEMMNKMDEIARKRDRSLTPPDMKHYEADKEFRTKGVGFYSFSKDESLRMEEMRALERERAETERVRKAREEAKEKRKREIEERRKAIGEERARKQAESFLDGLIPDIAPPENPKMD